MKKKLLLSVLSLGILVGCSSTNNQNVSNILPQENSISALSAKTASTRLPVLVTFNNAYKTTVQENEAIGRKYAKNPDKYFLGIIQNAKKTLEGAFYDMEDMDMTNAFIAAHKRGVKVKLVTDTDALVDKHDKTKPREAVVALKKAGIVVKDDKRSAIMHQKFLIVDNEKLWTGSMNLTTSSIYHHNNNSILINSKKMAANYKAEFDRLFDEGKFGPNAHEIPYKSVTVSGIKMETYFSPKGGTLDAVIKEVQKAKKSIRFMTFSLTNKEISNLIIEKKNAGVKVEGLFDSCMSRNRYSFYWPFKKAGIKAYQDGNQALLHHKVIIIDDETVITGSFNYSNNAEKSNNENTLVIHGANIAKIYNGEFNRLRSAAFDNKNIPNYDHPACGSRR